MGRGGKGETLCFDLDDNEKLRRRPTPSLRPYHGSRTEARPCDLSSRASTVSISPLRPSPFLCPSVFRPISVNCIMYNDGDDNNSNNNDNNNNNRSQCFYEPCSVSVPHPNAGNFKCVYGPLVLIGQRSLLSSSSSSSSPSSPITPDASDVRCFCYYFYRYRRCV